MFSYQCSFVVVLSDSLYIIAYLFFPVNNFFKSFLFFFCSLATALIVYSTIRIMSTLFLIIFLLFLALLLTFLFFHIIVMYSYDDTRISNHHSINSSTPEHTCLQDVRRTSCDKTHMRIFATRRRIFSQCDSSPTEIKKQDRRTNFD